MGFNLIVRSVLRGGAFLLGIAITAALLSLINDTFQGIWLPLAYWLCIALICGYQSWMRPARLAWPYSTAIGSGTVMTYCLSTPAGTHWGQFFPAFAIFLQLSLCGASLLWFVSRGVNMKAGSPMVIWLMIPVAASLVVGYVSGGIGGANHMTPWFIRLFHVPPEYADSVVHWVRKTIHFTAYGSVGWTLFRGAYAGRAMQGMAILFALSGVLCLAAFDETRQTAFSNRTGSAWDVLLDMSGATFFVGISALRRSKPQKPSFA